MKLLRTTTTLLAVFVAAPLLAAEGHAERFAEARIHFQKGRVDEALEVYDALEKDGADAVEIAVGRSRCLESRGELEQATDLLTAAAKKAEKSAVAWARLAELQLAQGAFGPPGESVKVALALDGELPLARLVQADLLAATGKLKEADEGYRWFVRYYNRKQPEDAETLLLVARGSAQYARWHSVSQIFDFVVNTLCPDALKKDPNCWEAHYLGGALLLEKYNRAQALPELRKALTINARAAEVHAALGEAALQDHSLKDAGQHAERALEINPRLVPALLIKADLHLEDGALDAAIKILEDAMEVNPHDERTLGRLAACYLLLDGPPAKKEINELFSNLDNISEADVPNPGRFGRLVMELAKRNPHPGMFLTVLGSELEGRKKFELAERCYKQAMASMPQLAEPKTALGMLAMRVGKIDEARKILDQALDADPYHVRVSNMRKVLKLLDGYEAITTEHFVIRVDSQADKLLGKYMAEYLEEEYAGLVKQFGFEPPARTQFEVYNKAKGLSAHQWFSARMVGLPWVQTIGASTGMIVALASPTASDKPFNWARIVKHEFVHIVTLQQTEFNIPHWFTEALAVMSEGYPRPELWNQLLLERVPKGDLMNLDNINLGFIRPKSPMDWNMAYCQSRLYAQYMIEKFGPETIGKLLDAYRNNLTTDQAIPKVFGVRKAEFEEGYRDYLSKLVGNMLIVAVAGKDAGDSRPLAEIERAHQENPDDARAAARLAYAYLKANRRKEARQLAEAALARNKAEPLAAVTMAQLELRGEDLDAAVSFLEPALDRENPDPLVLELLAQTRSKQAKFAEAADLFGLGLRRDPDHVPWLKGLAAAYLKSGDTARLRTVLERIAVTDADDATVRLKLAKMSLDEKNYEEAVKYARMALQVDVLDPETHRVLGEAYSKLGRKEKAEEEFKTAATLKEGLKRNDGGKKEEEQ